MWIDAPVHSGFGVANIRIEWSNSRNQSIPIEGYTPKDIASALIYAGQLIESEINDGNL